MDYIKSICFANKQRIAAAPNAAKEITDIMFDHIRNDILEIVDYDAFVVKHRKIVIMGGIQINVQPDDYFEPRVFIVLDENGTHDRLDELLAFDKINVKDKKVPIRLKMKDTLVMENVTQRVRSHSAHMDTKTDLSFSEASTQQISCNLTTRITVSFGQSFSAGVFQSGERSEAS